MIRVLTVPLLFLSIVSSAASADARIISWQDLLPVIDPLENPLTGVDREIREDLAILARIKIDIAQGFLGEGSPEVVKANARIEARSSQGIDLLALQKVVTDYEAELDRRENMINNELDGDLISIPGYTVPLETTIVGTTEFFLVPFFGACIHVPPPPPNQIVSITLNKPQQLGAISEPVWITGRMKTELASQSLSLVDGTADIPYGYRLTDVRIEPYR